MIGNVRQRWTQYVPTLLRPHTSTHADGPRDADKIPSISSKILRKQPLETDVLFNEVLTFVACRVYQKHQPFKPSTHHTESSENSYDSSTADPDVNKFLN